MKTLFLSTLFATFFLFLILGLNAQKLEYKKINKSVVVKNENFTSLLKPYKDKGFPILYTVKNDTKMKEWFQGIRSNVLPDSISEKIRSERNIMIDLYFDREGKVIDVTLQISLAIYDKLTEEDIRYMYNELIKARVNMDNLSWDGEFTYSHCMYLLIPPQPRR